MGFAKWLFAAGGWKISGHPLPVRRLVVAVAFHTSNWDAFPALVSNIMLGSRVSWVAKRSIFWWPLGVVLRAMGGVPVQRNSKEDFVSQIVRRFETSDDFILAIAPEGTRQASPRWKTGFYYIALKAGVPIQPAALDWTNKTFVFGELFYPTGQIQEDLKVLREFYRPYQPKWPDRSIVDFEV